MSTTTIDELQVLISANSSKFQGEIAKVRSELASVSQNAKGSGESIAGGFFKAQLAIGALKTAFSGLSQVLSASVKEFGSLEQNLGGAEAVFGEFADGIKQKAKDSARVMGTSMSQYLASANKMGSLFQGAGYSARDSMVMTADSMQRAADVASVMGISQEAALESIAGMAKGNFTMMDNLGVAMNDTALKAYILERGIAGNVEKMSTAEKVGIAYQMFMDRTSKYAGNFAREATTLEGSLAIMRAELANVGAQLGEAFAPMVAAAANFVSNVLAPAIGAVIPYIVALGQIIQQVASQVFGFIGGIFGVKKAVGGVTGATIQAGNSMKSLGVQAGGAGGGMGKAASGAKKLKKELLGLAKFDEMNVLKTPDDPSGGGGGGAGGGGAPALEIPEMNFGKFNSGFDEVSAKAKKIADEIRAYFSNLFDFKKIGAAFARFWDDIKKGASPVFKVIADIWKSYLEPFVKWAGNDLLPAFLNALGGAARLLGVAFKAAYDFAKPFIDAFLVPLAKFAGGVIVGFLNGIGDAFRAISENKGLVEFLTGTAMAIGGLVVAIKAATAIKDFNGGIQTMRTLMLSSPQAMASLTASLGNIKSAFVLAGGGIGGIKAAFMALAGTVKTSVIGAFNAVMAHPLILAAAGIVAGIVFIGGSIKSAFEQGNPALWESQAKTKALQKAQEELKTATENVKTTEENLKTARESAIGSQIAYTEAIKQEEQARQAQKALLDQLNISEAQKNEIIARGAENYALLNETERQVYDAHLQLESATARVQTSQDALNRSNAEAKSKEEEHKKALDETKSQMLANMVANGMLEGKYNSMSHAIESLKGDTIEYKDENGNMVKVSSEDISRLEGTVKDKTREIAKSYRDSKSGADQGFFGPMGRSLAQVGDWMGQMANTAGTEMGKFSQHIKDKARDAWNGITSFFGGIGRWFGDRWNDAKNAFKDAWQAFSNIGKNIWEGLKSGIGNLARKVGDMFKNAVDGVKNFLGIHSPSRLFKSYGGFVSEGFALGIDSEQKSVAKAFSRMTDFEIPEYRVRTNFDTEVPDYGISQIANARLEFQNQEFESNQTAFEKLQGAIEAQKQQITVKVGEDTLVNKIIDGVNSRSFLENRTVFDL